MKERSSLCVSLGVNELMKSISSGFKVINSIYIISGHHLQKKRGKEKETELEAG